MSSRINFSEPLPDVIERLKREHRQFDSLLVELEKISDYDSNKQKTVKILDELNAPLVHHAVEEEAIVLRVIMQKAREQSAESIKIIQEHNGIVDFLKEKVPKLERVSELEANELIAQFIRNLRSHFMKEEKIVFPLALKASSSNG